MTDKVDAVSGKEAQSNRGWVGYVVPTALFLFLTTLEGYFPTHYVLVYIVKIVVVTLSLGIYRSTLRDFRFEARALVPGLLVGLLIFAIWIPVDKLTPYHLPLGSRAAFDPFARIADPGRLGLFLFARFYGLVVMVPIMEELFWRSFLLRYFSDPNIDFRAIPMGQFTWGAFALVAAAFALAHPEWLSAAICGIAYGLLLWRMRSLLAPLVAHMVTNLALGIYIVSTHAWIYW